jgi:hypothetical protein
MLTNDDLRMSLRSVILMKLPAASGRGIKIFDMVPLSA